MALAFKLKDYLLCVHRIDPLQGSELARALKGVAKGEERSRRLLEERFLRHVVAWVQPYRAQGLPFLGLIESGNRALLKAIRNWKSEVGPFEDFAERMVSEEVEARLLARRA